MRQISIKTTALIASAAITLCSFPTFPGMYADAVSAESYTVHYDISEEGVYIPEDDDGNVPVLEDETVDAGSSFYITDVCPEKEGFIFSGWTYDDIIGYTAGDVCRINLSDITLRPVWVDKEDSDFHKITFYVEKDGVPDEEAMKLYVPAQKQLTGRFITIPLMTFPQNGYKQRGWKDENHEYAPQQKVIVHDEDMVLTPNMKKLYTLRYSVGDADRINGVTFLEFENPEGETTNLQSLDRFSRSGYKIKAWHCEYDGKDYGANAQFTMPSQDVEITPVWDPINYVVVFRPSSDSKDNIKINGYTDTKIIAPECTYVKEGYKFIGWQYKDTIVQPGEEYLILGEKPGMGIAFKSLWEADSSATTTTTTTTTTTSSAVTTTTSTSAVTSSATTVSSTTVSQQNNDTVYGDANCDGNVDMADVVLIMQALANPNKFDINGTDDGHITKQGRINGNADRREENLTSADVPEPSDDLTIGDALAIQLYLLGKYESLPILK